MVPWFDQKTLGVLRLPEVASTPQGVVVSAPLVASAQPGLQGVFGLSDSLAGRLEKWAPSGLGFSLRSLQGARSFPVAELKPLLPLRVELPSFSLADVVGEGRPQPAGQVRGSLIPRTVAAGVGVAAPRRSGWALLPALCADEMLLYS